MYKFAFFLLSGVNGRGGHLYSARDLGMSFENAGIEVDYFGLCNSEVDIQPLSHVPKYKRIQNHQGVWGTIKSLRYNFYLDEYDAVIVLDEMAVRLLSVSFPLSIEKIIAIKPGWINSKAWAPNTGALVCFSSENYEYYKAKKKYKRTNLHLIPQRVLPAQPSPQLLNALRKDFNLGSYDLIIMAAGRLDFGEGHSPGKKEIFDYSLSLYARYKKLGCRPFLFFAGKAKDQKTRNQAIAMIQNLEGAALLDDDKYTAKLSSILSVSDVVIGYGRTAMEAMSLAVPVIVPVSKGDAGVLVSKSSFGALQFCNFTNRINVSAVDIAAEKFEIDKLLDVEFRTQSGDEAKQLFLEKLSAIAAVPIYIKLTKEIVKLSLYTKLNTCVFSLFRILMFFKAKKYINKFRSLTKNIKT
jgi:hypothetical protein